MATKDELKQECQDIIDSLDLSEEESQTLETELENADTKAKLEDLLNQLKEREDTDHDTGEEEETPEDEDQESKPEEESDNDFDKVSKTSDFKSFVKIQQVLGYLADDVNPNNLSEKLKAELVAAYHGWVQAGKPKPQMNAKVESKKEQILAVYRKKAYGKHKIYYKVKGKDLPKGVKLIPEYRVIPDPKNPSKTIEDKTSVTSWTRDYTIDYTPELCAELMERCVKESSDPKFYFVEQNRKYTVTDPEAHFNGDFDKVIKEARASKVI